MRLRVLPAIILCALIGQAFAAGDWRIFEEQKNGLVREKLATGVDAFRSKPLPGSDWSETWYHEMNLEGQTMICVSFTINQKEASGYITVAGTDREGFNEIFVMDIENVKIDPEGFGISFGRNRIELKGDEYLISLNLEKARAQIRYRILAPDCGFGDSLVWFPDGKSYIYHDLPIPWAEVEVDLEIEGGREKLKGFGSMNRDSMVLSLFRATPSWRAFWFYEDDFVLDVVDYNPNDSFGQALVQRLVFVDDEGRMFTSTSYEHSWDDWVKAPDVNFRYPKHYRILAEAGGDRIEVDIRLEKVIIKADLFSNIPSILRFIAERITKNGWGYDFWCSYTLTTTIEGVTKVRKGSGVGRWVALED